MIGEFVPSFSLSRLELSTVEPAPAGRVSPYASRYVTGSGAASVAAATSFTREAAPHLLVSGPIITGPQEPVPLDRAIAPVTATESGASKVSPTMIAAGLVALGVAGLVFYKLRK
jgi:hypothetical protein